MRSTCGDDIGGQGGRRDDDVGVDGFANRGSVDAAGEEIIAERMKE